MADPFEAFRARLLDLTRRNSLLNYKHPRQRSLRIVDELPDQLFTSLSDGVTFTFAPVPEPPKFKDADSATLEMYPDRAGQRLRPDVAEWARHQGIRTDYELPSASTAEDARHRDRKIQVLFYPEDLEAQLGNISRLAKTAMEESGVNILYLAFGFLEWRAKDGTDLNLAPLLLLPVTVAKAGIDPRTHRYKYEIKYSEEDLEANLSLREMLKLSFGLKLPDLDDEDTPESYLLKCAPLLVAQPEWRIHRHVTLGFFQFGKLLMYLDLDPANWPAGHGLAEHPIIKRMIEGDIAGSSDVAVQHDIDALKPASPEFQLIQEADSSQHSAIIDAAAGKSMVIEGPPGTGKSQTITNIIATALNQGKSVLFVAEKSAALKVVKDRLDDAGLGMFCLELHSNRAGKKPFYEELKRRRAFRTDRGRFAALERRVGELERMRKTLNAYAELMGRRHEGLGLSHSDLFGRCAALQARIPHGALKVEELKGGPGTPLDSDWLATLDSRASRADDARRAIIRVHGSVDAHPWAWLTPKARLDAHDAPVDAAASWLSSLLALRSAAAPLFACCVDPGSLTPAALGGLAEVQSRLPPPSDLPLEPLARLLQDEKELEKLGSQARMEDALAAAHVRLAGCYDADRLADPAWFPTLVRAAKAVDNAPVRLVGRTMIAALEARSAIAAWVAVQPDVASAMVHVQGQLPLKVALGLDAVKGCAMVLTACRNVPFDALPHRYAGLEQVTDVAAVEAIQAEIDSLIQERNKSNLFFHVAASDDLGHLSAAAEVLVEGGLLSFLDGQWRSANEIYRQACRARSWFKPSWKKGKELMDLVELRTKLKEFRSHPKHSALLGKGFRGLETPVRQYAALIRWFGQAKEKIGQHGNHGAVSLALAALPEDKLRSLHAMSTGTQAQVLEHALAVLATLRAGLTATDVQQVTGDPATTPPAASWIGSLGESLDALAAGIKDPTQTLGDVTALVHDYGRQATDPERIRGRERFGLGQDAASPLDAGYRRSLDTLMAWSTALWMPGAIMRTYYAEAVGHGNVIGAHVALQGLANAAREESEACTALTAGFAVFHGQGDSDGTGRDQPLDAAVALVSGGIERADQWAGWAGYTDAVHSIHGMDANLAPLARAYHRGEIDVGQLRDRAQYMLLNTHVRMARKEHETLRNFSEASHEELRKRFAETDKQVCMLHRELVAHRAAQPVPPQGRGGPRVRDMTQMALLEQQMSLQRPRMPLRQVMAKAGAAVQTLKPCFMMGPLSVAQFLKPGANHFDMIVMDEASQMRPEEALGAVARGTQLIVVGDPKQLPPTTFFDRLSADDGGASDDAMATGDQESILEMATPLFRPSRMLEWHYRSKHESLIAFSNHHFYHDRLLLFPTALARSEGLGVHYARVKDGRFKAGVNQREAAEVVRAALREIRRTGGDQTIAIVAMNVLQVAAIRHEWDKQLKEMDDLRAIVDKLEARDNEPFDIKNLENVQGDERDIIVISMTYGRDEADNFYQRFGPINQQDGWRRLNVLFTRARRKMAVYSSMDSADIVPGPQSGGGPAALRGFLEYCERGCKLVDAPVHTDRPPANEFEDQVIEIVVQEGFGAEPQVGVCGYFIDVGVTHPSAPGRYLLGIECDGSMYHSSKFARDRDKLREQALVSMGWTIHRVWAPDWFSWDRSAQARLRDALRRLKETLPTAPIIVPERRESTRDPNALRNSLHGLRRKMEEEYPDVPAERRLLRGEMLELLIKHRPTSRDEFGAAIPGDLRTGTDPGEAAGHLDTVLSVIEDHA